MTVLLLAAGDRSTVLARPNSFIPTPANAWPLLHLRIARHPDVLGDARVRQALAHVIDRTGAGFVAFGESALDLHLVDHLRATALLEEAGWTRACDTWIMSDGEQAQVELIFPNDSADVRAAAHFVAQNLTDFGIQCQLQAETRADHSMPGVPTDRSSLVLTGGRQVYTGDHENRLACRRYPSYHT